jgi:hypothetical protein
MPEMPQDDFGDIYLRGKAVDAAQWLLKGD